MSQKRTVTAVEQLILSTQVGMVERWNRPRFYKLAEMLGYTNRELAAFVGVSQSFTKFEKANAFPLPACILLQTLENFILTAHGITPLYPTAIELIRKPSI